MAPQVHGLLPPLPQETFPYQGLHRVTDQLIKYPVSPGGMSVR